MYNVPIVLSGKSGKKYSFPLNPIKMVRNENLAETPVVYVVAKTEILITAQRDKLLVYIGETDNKNTFLNDHPMKDSFKEHGGDQVAFIDIANKAEREKVVQDIRDAYAILC